MENWGLITFRETALLFDPKANSASAEKRVASVVAHEIAHQWFGNLGKTHAEFDIISGIKCFLSSDYGVVG